MEGGSGGGDTSPNGMHDSPRKRTGPPLQEGMRGLMIPGRKGLGMRVHTTRQARHESLDAPAEARPLMYAGAQSEPRVDQTGVGGLPPQDVEAEACSSQ